MWLIPASTTVFDGRWREQISSLSQESNQGRETLNGWFRSLSGSDRHSLRRSESHPFCCYSQAGNRCSAFWHLHFPSSWALICRIPALHAGIHTWRPLQCVTALYSGFMSVMLLMMLQIPSVLLICCRAPPPGRLLHLRVLTSGDSSGQLTPPPDPKPADFEDFLFFYLLNYDSAFKLT